VFLQQQQAPPSFATPLFFIVIIGIFYLIVFLPAQRQRKRLQQMIDNLKAGDKVVTSGGIYGTIVGFKDDRIQLRIAENVKIELSRNAVTALQEPEKE
jgi:preprotein translocase subunit YajC